MNADSRIRDPLVSVVVPVLDEAENLPLFFDALLDAGRQAETRLEIIFVDDGSTDDSYAIINDLAQRTPRVRGLKLSRNFGSHAALSAGLRAANGDAALLISADLQDPPALLTALLERWRAGYDVVWGVRRSRRDPWLKRALAGLFYRLLRAFVFSDYPRQGMDCMLVDRRVIEVVNSLEEGNRLLPPLLLWAGFRQTEVPYDRQARRAGVSGWPLAKRIKAAIDIVVSFSYLPIRLISFVGFTVSLVSFLYAVFLITRRLFFGLGGAGWPSLMVAILFLGGVQLVMLGVLGEYLWRISDEVRRRPLYIIDRQTGFGANERGAAAE